MIDLSTKILLHILYDLHFDHEACYDLPGRNG